MSDFLNNNRWSVSEDDFAVRVMIPDVKGFFKRLTGLGSSQLIIEPGTRALVVEDGVLVGEVPPGSYTLESFDESLQFWRKKQSTIFLTRCEDVPLESFARAIPCLDSICFDISYRWTIQVQDVVAFMHNLMGARDELPLHELDELLSPFVGQALRSTVTQSSFDELREADCVNRLADGIRSRCDTRLQRYGLKFVDLQTADLTCDDQGHEQRKGEIWLASRETQLQRAAATVENEQLSARLDDIRSKTEIRRQLRDAVSGDRFNKIQNRDDFEKMVAEIDQNRLLRREERESLIAAYEERKEDRTQLREHLLETLQIEREQELEELRTELDHAARVRSLQREAELSRLSQTQESEDWRLEVEREQQATAHRHQQKLERVRAAWERARESRRQKRDDKWDGILHQQKMAEVQEEMIFAKAERTRKIALMESELNSRLKTEKLELQKRRTEAELELQQQKSSNQMDRLQRVQEMNAQFAERQQRMQVELETLKADSASQRELDRIAAMSDLSTEAMVATAGVENAALLADLKKHEATQDAVKAQAEADPAAELNEERLRMYEKMNETERAKADAIADAYKTAMQSQQGNVQQMIGGLAQAATPTAPAPPGFPPPPPVPVADTWHVSLNGQQSPALQLAQVQQYIQSGQVTAATMVWKTGLSDWMAAGQVPELAGLFGGPARSGNPAAPPGPPPS